MRISQSLILILICITSYGQSALTLASDIWPPFTDQVGEKAIAFDIVKNALNRDEQGVQYTISTFEDVLSNIENGSADGSAALWYTSERSEYLEYSEPYLQNQLILIAKKGEKIDITSFDGLTDKRVGAVANYAYTDNEQAPKDVTFIYSESDQQNLENLLSGSVDYILVDAVLIQYLLKYQINDVSALLEIGTRPLITKSLHLAIRKDVSDAQAILANFNARIKEMKADGSYNRILGLSWIRTDVDGDGVYELVLEGPSAGVEAPTQVYDLLHVDVPSTPDRYFINGEIYNTWSDVPNNYKNEIANESRPDIDHVGLKFNINKKHPD